LRKLTAVPALAAGAMMAAAFTASPAAADTVKSKAFLDEAEKSKLEINPVSGEELQKIVEEITGAPDDLRKLAQAAVTKGAIFDRKALVKDAKLCAPAKKKKKKSS
jgi:hypothetical protein